MYNKEELIEVQKFFSKWHYRVLIAILLYLLADAIKSFTIDSPIFIRGLFICTLLMADCIFGFFDYFKMVRPVFWGKFIQLMALAFIIMKSGYQHYEYIAFSCIYAMVSVELCTFFDITEPLKRLAHSMFVVAPLIFSGVVYMFQIRTTDYLVSVFLVIFIEMISMLAMTRYLGARSDQFTRSLLAKDRIIDKALDNNKEILEKQQKLFNVNEQLGIKRVELESAYKKINTNILEMNLQNDLLKYFTSTFDISSISKYLADKLIDDMQVEYAGMLWLDQGDLDIKINVCNKDYCLYGKASDAVFKEIYQFFSTRIPSETSIPERLYIGRDIDYRTYPFFKEGGIRTFAAKGILIDGRLSGIYLICHKRLDFFAEKETYFENILNQFQVVLNNAFLYSQFSDMAKKDGLTGLYNRRFLNKYMEKFRRGGDEIKNEKIVTALFDIDNFKTINDTYGHLFGDVAIVSVAEIIRTKAEKYQAAAYRYGGEEFVIIFNDMEMAKALPIIEEIHQEIKNQIVTDGKTSIHVDTSAGVSAYPELCSNPSMVLDHTDRAMYASKANGKGRITVDEEKNNL